MIIDELKKMARDFLGDGNVDLIIGYGTNGMGDIVPLFIRTYLVLIPLRSI